MVIEVTRKLFNNQNAPIEALSVEDLENMEGVQKVRFDKNSFQTAPDVVSFLAEARIFSSKGEARKMILGGGVSINRQKITDIQHKVTAEHILHDKYLLVQRGKKNYYLVEIA